MILENPLIFSFLGLVYSDFLFVCFEYLALVFRFLIHSFEKEGEGGVCVNFP